MFYVFPYLGDHSVTKLHEYLIDFFEKIRTVSDKAVFKPSKAYFHEDFIIRLQAGDSLTELGERFKAFFNAFKVLLPVQKQALCDTFFNACLIDELLQGRGAKDINVLRLESFPASVQRAVGELFVYMYEKTLRNELGKHYKEIVPQLPNKTQFCSFCAIRKFPSKRRADYDHIMYKSTYPLMAVNLLNLVPICDECNRDFKKDKDVLKDKDGLRRRYLNPYTTCYPLKINLSGSQAPIANQREGNWVINFSIHDDLVEAWKEVFEIEWRYQKELTDGYDTWLTIFVNKCKKDIAKGRLRVYAEEQIRDALLDYADTFSDYLYHDSNLIKHALFGFLSCCNDSIFYTSVLRKINSN